LKIENANQPGNPSRTIRNQPRKTMAMQRRLSILSDWHLAERTEIGMSFLQTTFLVLENFQDISLQPMLEKSALTISSSRTSQKK